MRPLLPILVTAAFLSTATPAPIPAGAGQANFFAATKTGTVLVLERGGVEMKLKVTMVEARDGGVLVTYENVTAGMLSPYQKYLATPQGLYLANEIGQNYDPPWCVVRFPIKPGDRWEVHNCRETLDRGPVFRGTVVVLGEERVTVPAGAFQAIKVKWIMDKGPSSATYWYVRGLGVVKMELDDKPYLALKSVLLPGDSK